MLFQEHKRLTRDQLCIINLFHHLSILAGALEYTHCISAEE